MASRLLDTIVAPITGAQPAAVAIVRLSGPAAWSIARELFEPVPSKVVPRHAYYGTFSHGDDGLLIYFEEGKSFTGELSTECQIHGSPISVRKLLEAAQREGARLAEPGEFTYRAFMNGRLDLSQAEGVRESVEAMSSRQFYHANLLRRGELRHQLAHVSDRLYKVLAMIEASVDFSEEIGELDRPQAIEALPIVELQQLQEQAQRGILERQGLTVAITGPPNAGKSSLLNRLLGAERAIVTSQAGTTRDTVEEAAEINGMLVRFIDTAGLRDALDEAERQGVERSLLAAKAANRIWFVYDAASGWDDAVEGEWNRLGCPITIVANKSDLAPPARADHLPVSALTGAGMRELMGTLSSAEPNDEPIVSMNQRHLPLIERALASSLLAKEVFEQPIPDDLASVHLRDAVQAVGEITGDTASDDMIERIFRDFCIGK